MFFLGVGLSFFPLAFLLRLYGVILINALAARLFNDTFRKAGGGLAFLMESSFKVALFPTTKSSARARCRPKLSGDPPPPTRPSPFADGAEMFPFNYPAMLAPAQKNRGRGNPSTSIGLSRPRPQQHCKLCTAIRRNRRRRGVVAAPFAAKCHVRGAIFCTPPFDLEVIYIFS